MPYTVPVAPLIPTMSLGLCMTPDDLDHCGMGLADAATVV